MAAGLAIGFTAVRPPLKQALGVKIFNYQKSKLVFSPLAFSSSSSSSSSSSITRKLILYSKPGCCLCDGLKEKLNAAFSLSSPHSLHDVQLQVRDITSNPDWEKAYQYEIPVLARVRPDGTEILFRDQCVVVDHSTRQRLILSVQRGSLILDPVRGCVVRYKRFECSFGFEEVLPRLSPRLGVEAIHKKIAAALTE